MNRGKIIDLIIMDMDGTIFTSNVDWRSVKKKLNVHNSSILEKIYSSGVVDIDGLRYLEDIEEKNTLEAKTIDGSLEFVNEIRKRGIKVSLVTNNSRKNTNYLINKFNLSFDMIITRDEKMWKPSPSAFKFLMKKFEVEPENTISIGDSDLDITASVRSNISDIFIIKDSNITGNYTENINYFKDFHDLSNMIFNS
ncbi:MAG: HAD-IA family hydrolase [Candidatus Aminicenantes bacterium]|nr:HAD-IA family hydrolase [Candidatus Aminicenantes bacterium]